MYRKSVCGTFELIPNANCADIFLLRDYLYMWVCPLPWLNSHRRGQPAHRSISPVSNDFSRTGQPKHRSIYPVWNDFSRTGKYLNNIKEEMAPSCHLFFILLNIILPVREIGVKDRVYTSVRDYLSSSIRSERQGIYFRARFSLLTSYAPHHTRSGLP